MERGYTFGPGPLTPAVKALVYSNIAVFVVMLVVPSLITWIGLIPELVLTRAYVWQIVTYQLQRAVGGAHRLLQMVPVAPVVQRLQTSLLKVYADKGVVIELDVNADSVFRGDARDLMELLGILMDNACKYGNQRVRVTTTGGGSRSLVITVEDDGAGIPTQVHKAIFERGVRADRQQSGYGIGLAIAADLVESYLGTLQVARSKFGGAHLRVELP